MFASHHITSAQTNMSERNGTFVCLRINIHVCSEKNDQRSLDLLMILAICRPRLCYEEIETISDRCLIPDQFWCVEQATGVFAKQLKRIWKVNPSESLLQNWETVYLSRRSNLEIYFRIRRLSIFEGDPTQEFILELGECLSFKEIQFRDLFQNWDTVYLSRRSNLEIYFRIGRLSIFQGDPIQRCMTRLTATCQPLKVLQQICLYSRNRNENTKVKIELNY